MYDPREIPQTDMPLIVFSDVTYGWIAFLIKWRTKGNYDHAMLARNKGKFICQDFSGYHEIPMEQYLKKGNRLKFYSFKNINQQAIDALNQSIAYRMSRPWWQRSYDWIGIAGQAVGMPWIHTPGLEFCSVDDINRMRDMAKYLTERDQVVIAGIGNQWNPQQLEEYCYAHPETFKEYGKYEADDGIVV